MPASSKKTSIPDRNPIAICGAEIRYLPGFLRPAEADGLLTDLASALPWTQADITLFGKTHRQPRLMCWMGDEGANYRYSGTTYRPAPWHPRVSALRQRVVNFCNAGFNSVLINQYRDGQDCMGWHADDEQELGERPVIASVSLGATRDFRLRRKDGAQAPITVALEHGSLLVMSGDSQHNWQHCLPRRARVTQPRINLTFRQVLAPPVVNTA